MSTINEQRINNIVEKFRNKAIELKLFIKNNTH